MDSECKRLVDEMWQSYLCEENVDSFYEPFTSNPYIDNAQLETEVFSQESLDPSNLIFGTDVAEVQGGWNPFENLFELLEEILLFEEGHGGECPFCHHSNVDSKMSHQEIIKHSNEKTTTLNVKTPICSFSETENKVINNKDETAALRKNRKRSSKNTSDHHGKQKKKTADK